jgi:hypothetical protein
MLQPIVSRPVPLGIKPHLGPRTRVLLLLDSCGFVGQVKVKVTLRLTASRSVTYGVQPHLRLMTKYLLLFDSYGLVFVGRPL